MQRALRLRTYLSPSIPLGLYEAIAAAAARRLGCRVELQSETRWSGPQRGADPFADGDVDAAFVCTPSYLSLTQGHGRAATLLPLAPVFDDPRAGGRPVYFSDLVVRDDNDVRSLHDLGGAVWAYNDRCSLSGYWGMLKALRAAELSTAHFGRLLHAGSHLDSAAAVVAGDAGVAAMDSNALRLLASSAPDVAGRLRRIDSVGPQPIQPVVVRRDLDPRLRRGLAGVLRDAARDLRFREALAPFGVTGFARVTHAHYAAERAGLTACATLAA
ncbi:MAG: PhnD/SsuA/transferrin family substrate-binding protein [Planctomycetota bacterium]|jgi:phosphonate transport system substrate-binding protein